MRKHILLVMTAILVLALATVALAADPFVGTWKLNVQKSSTSMPYKSVTAKITALDNGLNIVTDLVDTSGKASHSDGAEIFDGKDHPDPLSPLGTAVCTRVDVNTVVVVFKKDGKELGRSLDVVSKDGKTITRTQTRKNSTGQDVNVTAVYEKQ